MPLCRPCIRQVLTRDGGRAVAAAMSTLHPSGLRREVNDSSRKRMAGTFGWYERMKPLLSLLSALHLSGFISYFKLSVAHFF